MTIAPEFPLNPAANLAWDLPHLPPTLQQTVHDLLRRACTRDSVRQKQHV